ncbi:MAG: Amidohydrolase [Candidatus Bathyarchaeota archaeon BA1]|nr:MAG: Amidohydrolase [Candidatus Bathyarchaeota archaeon BA1]
MAFTYPNGYIGISCVNFSKRFLNNLLRNTVDVVGTDKLLFGSDAAPWPYMIPLAVNNVKNLDFLSEKEKNMILEENAKRLIPAPGASKKRVRALAIYDGYVRSCAQIKVKILSKDNNSNKCGSNDPSVLNGQIYSSPRVGK